MTMPRRNQKLSLPGGCLFHLPPHGLPRSVTIGAAVRGSKDQGVAPSRSHRSS